MNKNLKNKIISSLQKETPDMRDKIQSACKEKEQVLPDVANEKKTFFKNLTITRIVATIACVVLFITGISTGFLIMRGAVAKHSTPQTFVYLDVNPSIKISLNEDNRILSCIALNEDAETVISGLDLKWVDIKLGLNAIISAMYVKGYLVAKENAMLISVESNDEDNNKQEFLSYLTKQINNVFNQSEMKCSIIAQTIKPSEDLISRAKAQGISVGKMYLVDKTAEKMGNKNVENINNLSTMSIRQLNLIYSTNAQANGNVSNDVISGNVGGYLSQDMAIQKLFEYLQIGIEPVEYYKVRADYKNSADRRIIYIIEIKLQEEATARRYEVDCETGDVCEYRNEEGRMLILN